MMEGAKREYKLEPDCELRFEIESKSRKVTLEVGTKSTRYPVGRLEVNGIKIFNS